MCFPGIIVNLKTKAEPYCSSFSVVQVSISWLSGWDKVGSICEKLPIVPYFVQRREFRGYQISPKPTKLSATRNKKNHKGKWSQFTFKQQIIDRKIFISLTDVTMFTIRLYSRLSLVPGARLDRTVMLYLSSNQLVELSWQYLR